MAARLGAPPHHLAQRVAARADQDLLAGPAPKECAELRRDAGTVPETECEHAPDGDQGALPSTPTAAAVCLLKAARRQRGLQGGSWLHCLRREQHWAPREAKLPAALPALKETLVASEKNSSGNSQEMYCRSHPKLE